MVGAHQNVNGSPDWTTNHCHPGLALAMINLSTKFELSISTHYNDMNCNKKMEMGGLGQLDVTQGH